MCNVSIINRKDHMVDTNDSIYTMVTPLVITKCMSLIHLHVAHSAYLKIQCYLAHHGISIGHLVCSGRLALPQTVTGRVW